VTAHAAWYPVDTSTYVNGSADAGDGVDATTMTADAVAASPAHSALRNREAGRTGR
jgi:hypothetical protein